MYVPVIRDTIHEFENTSYNSHFVIQQNPPRQRFSSQSCGQHYRLSFKIIKPSDDRNERSNIVIAPVPFSNIIDDNRRDCLGFKLSAEEEHADGAYLSCHERSPRSHGQLGQMVKVP
ncbi:hypothetical protein CPC08DRAFT_237184 [Agrocybe pediades]|nr:hypothetical protein CPC08DRAFT_237184 [Agrocybe pediades]